jgi:hypothetical protein
VDGDPLFGDTDARGLPECVHGSEQSGFAKMKFSPAV